MAGTRSQAAKGKDAAAAGSQTTTGCEIVRMEDLPHDIEEKIPQYEEKLGEALEYAKQARELGEEAKKFTDERQEYLSKSEHQQKLAQKYKSKADEYFVRVEHVDASNEEGESSAWQTTKHMKLDTQVKSEEFHEKYLQEHATAQNFKLQSEDCLKKAAEAEDSARDFFIAAETLLATRFD